MSPVLEYLDCLYSSPEGGADTAQDTAAILSEASMPGNLNKSGAESRSASDMELLDVYRHLLDGQGAAPGP